MVHISDSGALRQRLLDKQSLLIYGALVLVHALMGVGRRGPFFFGDEWGYLGAARYLAGAGPVPNMGRSNFYHVGYSLFLAPAYKLSPPNLVYVGVMVTNALLLASVFLALVALLRSMLRVDVARSRWIALAATLYPAFGLHSKIAWAESLLIPLFAWTVVSVHKLATNRSSAWGFALGSSTALLYIAHGRMLPVLAVVALFVTYQILVRGLPARAIVSTTLAFAVVLGIGAFLNAHLREVAYHPAVPILDLFGPSTELGTDGARWFLFEAVGQLWYLTAATFGLFVLGAIEAARLALRGQTHATRLTARFLLLASSAAFTVSAYFMMNQRGAHHAIYGRYNEAFLAPFLSLGIASLLFATRGVDLGRACLIVMGALALLAVLLPLGPGSHRLEQERIVTPNVLGIAHAISFFGGLRVAAITLFAATTLVLVTVIAWRHRTAGVVMVALMFATFTTQTYFGRSLGTRGTRLTDFIHAVELHELETVAYDSAYRRNGFWEYQFWLEKTRMQKFNSKIANPPSRFVISAPTWPEGKRCDARRLAVDPALKQALWVIGDGCTTPPPS